MKKPIIGLTAYPSTDDSIVFKVNQSYVNAILKAGGIPMIIPVTSSDVALALIDIADGLLIPGGQDVSPNLYQEEPVPQVTIHKKQFDLFEFDLIKTAFSSGKPILGICRGVQLINVAFGGSLYQDIPSQVHSPICHVQSTVVSAEGTHSITITPNTILHQTINTSKILVNSFHHQSIKDVAANFIVSARAPDGIIEGIESTNGQIIGLQWHPEKMDDTTLFDSLFFNFIQKCANISK